MRKLGGMISDELLISKEKVELSASICKTDLTSDLVGEFPELQGIMGGYFSAQQGFDKVYDPSSFVNRWLFGKWF